MQGTVGRGSLLLEKEREGILSSTQGTERGRNVGNMDEAAKGYKITSLV